MEDVKESGTSTEVPVTKITPVPTEEPIAEQTNVPTEEPTAVPTAEPTAVPTEEPTKEPVATETPTTIPTMVPTEAPTKEPVVEATAVPTEQPVVTTAPTEQPVVTAEPTAQPTVAPTEPPQITPAPTQEPVCRHNWVFEVTQEPTCSVRGIQKEYCTLCGQNSSYDIPIVDHKMENGTCIWCGKTEETAHQHNWVMVSIYQPSTCACEGTGIFNCYGCGESKYEQLPRLDTHNYVKVKDGCGNAVSEFECTMCDAKYTSIDSSCTDGNGDGLCDKCNGLVQ